MSSEMQDKQTALDCRYLRMAQIWAENSYCIRRQVGALLVKNKTIISDGYNGTPAGFKNICEDENGHTYPYVLHAEANAITKIARSGTSSEVASHRMFETDYTGRYHPGRFFGALPTERRYRIAKRGRYQSRFYRYKINTPLNT